MRALQPRPPGHVIKRLLPPRYSERGLFHTRHQPPRAVRPEDRAPHCHYHAGCEMVLVRGPIPRFALAEGYRRYYRHFWKCCVDGCHFVQTVTEKEKR